MKRRLTKSELALMLTQHGYTTEGGKPIDIRQVWAWYDRRASNGFPEEKGFEERRRNKLDPVFDPDEVLKWRRNYVPAKGGRPASRKVAA